MKRIAGVCFLVSLSCFTTAVHAERLFISDKLVVSVYAQADQESEKLATMDSGDAVEALERVEGYTKVKLSDDREGWIRSSYLVGQAPAIVRLKELEKERGASASTTSAAAAEEIKQLKEQNSNLSAQIESLKKAAKLAVVPSETPEDTLKPSITNEVSYRHVLQWGGGIALIAGLIGFAWGYRTLAKRIERKYGKLRIY